MAIQSLIKEENVHVGDTVRVYQKIKEEGRERTQAFEGVVISIKGRQAGKSFTVRKIASSNIGVERIWPVLSPSISKIKVIKKGKVRRSKLYYLRQRKGKQALRIKSLDTKVKKQVKPQAKSAKKETGKKGRRSSSKTPKN